MMYLNEMLKHFWTILFLLNSFCCEIAKHANSHIEPQLFDVNNNVRILMILVTFVISFTSLRPCFNCKRSNKQFYKEESCFDHLRDVRATSKTVTKSTWNSFFVMIMQIQSILVYDSFSIDFYSYWLSISIWTMFPIW